MKFQGEIPPFADTSFTHGMCEGCEQIGIDWSPEQEKKINQLKDLHGRFWSAGNRAEEAEIASLIAEAASIGVRSIDMLFAFTGPALVKVGELWASNLLTVADEHAFSQSSMRVIEIVSERIQRELAAAGLVGTTYRALLANVSGNVHDIGLRFASLGLAGLGIQTKTLPVGISPSELVSSSVSEKPDFVGLSISMQLQEEMLQSTVELLLAESSFTGKIVVGGFAINENVIQSIESDRVHFLTRPKFDKTDLNFLRRL